MPIEIEITPTRTRRLAIREIQKLEQQRQAWEAILELMPDPVLLIDETGRIQAMNDQFEALCGQRRAGLYDNTLDKFLTVDRQPLINEQQTITKLLHGKGISPGEPLELGFKQSSATTIPVLLSMRPCQGHPQLCDGFIVSITNIQALRGVQENLKQEKHRFESLFNSISDAVFLAPLTTEGVHGNFVEVNDVACRRLGYSRNEMLKMNARSINPNYNLEKVKAFGKRIRREGEVQFDAIHVARDGTQIPVGVTATLVNIANEEYVLSVARDLREIKQKEKAEERFGRLLDHSWDEILIFEADGLTIVQANDGALDNLGYNSSEILAMTYDQLLGDMDKYDLQQTLKPLNDGLDSVVIFEANHRRKDGSEYPVEIRVQMSHSEVPAVYLVNVHDITERKKAEERLHFLANYDLLTGLPNRGLMMDRLGQALENSKRTQNTCALIFMDLDGFKEVNDTLGHDAGDNLLKVVAIRLQESLRKSDTIARLGGDEFTILLQNLHSVRDVDRIAEKIIKEISRPVLISGQEVVVTTSLGVSIFPTSNDDVNSLLRKSDSAMYVAKKTGKNKWCLYQESGAPTRD